MAVSLLPNWLHVALTFLLLPGEFYSFLLSGSVPLVHFVLPVHVQDEEHTSCLFCVVGWFIFHTYLLYNLILLYAMY